ncbi:hypothetical protein AB1L05_08990 [Cytobacillus horneckiae]|uniref:hypothetical protein n=1 Tax=Cytobacillus horneckiae TaxID=549687 RepID=UPI00399F8302
MDNLERARLLIDFLSELRLYHQEGMANEETIQKVSNEVVGILIPHKEVCSMCGSEEVELTSVIADKNKICITKTCFTCGVTENKVPPTSSKEN